MVCILLSQIEEIKVIISIKINNLVQIRKKVTANNVLLRVRRLESVDQDKRQKSKIITLKG